MMLSQSTSIALPVLVVMPGLAATGLVFQKGFEIEKIGKSNRRARTLDPSPVFAAKSGSKAAQMASKMEPISRKN